MEQTLSRRRDRERVEAMRRLDPDYRGFRGHGREPTRPGNTPLQAVMCSACGRKRNVPRGVAEEQGDSYVCLRCAEDGATATPEEARPAS